MRILLTSFCLSLIVLGFGQIPQGNLVAFYPFDGNTDDVSGNAHHLSIMELFYRRIVLGG